MIYVDLIQTLVMHHCSLLDKISNSCLHAPFRHRVRELHLLKKTTFTPILHILHSCILVQNANFSHLRKKIYEESQKLFYRAELVPITVNTQQFTDFNSDAPSSSMNFWVLLLLTFHIFPKFQILGQKWLFPKWCISGKSSSNGNCPS